MVAEPTKFPPPPVPAGATLKDFPYMPLEIERLRASRSWLACRRKPHLAFYLMNLWMAAYHATPAGGLDDDDDVLANAAMCSPERWEEVKADVLKGWTRCSDDRLYHPVVVEKVIPNLNLKINRLKARIGQMERKMGASSDQKKSWLIERVEDLKSKIVAYGGQPPAPEKGEIEKENREREIEKGERRKRKGKGKVGSVNSQQEDSAEAESESENILTAGANARAREQAPAAGSGLNGSSPGHLAVEAFNEVAAAVGWPKAGRLSAAQRSALDARLGELGGIAEWRGLLGRAAASSYLRGDPAARAGSSNPNWKPTLGWLLKPDTCAKLQNGTYDSDNFPRSTGRRNSFNM